MKGRVALVTGGSGGIGRAISLRLATNGARVIVNYHANEEAAAAVVAEIEGRGDEALAIRADIADVEQVEHLVKTAVDAYGKIDILINNAGITRDAILPRQKIADFDAVVNTNLRSAWLMCKEVLRGMMRKRYGRIINISSVSALMGNAGQTNYAASKAGLIGLSKSLAREVASRGITVNVIAPGFITTEMTANLPKEIAETAREHIPLGRFGESAEVAAAVAFLASEEAGYVTGQVLSVNGGLYM